MTNVKRLICYFVFILAINDYKKREKNFDELRITQRWEQGQRETYSSINYVLST